MVLQFSGHETFPLRQLWLRKAFCAVSKSSNVSQHSVFSGEDAIVRFGVGKNMVASIRFWATACNVIEEAKDRYLPGELGYFLFSEWCGRDPFCERPGTTWLMHWQTKLSTKRK